MEKTDIIYYLSIGIICFIILYIIYISVNFNNSQEDNLENFSLGGIGKDKKDKKDKKNKKSSSKVEKAIENLETENEKLDDIIDMDNESDNIKKLLEIYKENIDKQMLKNIIDNPQNIGLIGMYKLNIESLDMLIENL